MENVDYLSGSKRIILVSDPQHIGAYLKKDFPEATFLPIRIRTVSLDGNKTIKYDPLSDKPPVVIKCLDFVLANGTNFDYDSGKDFPIEVKKFCFGAKGSSLLFKNFLDCDSYLESLISGSYLTAPEREILKPALIVYDPSSMREASSIGLSGPKYELVIPGDRTLKDSIVKKIYVNNLPFENFSTPRDMVPL